VGGVGGGVRVGGGGGGGWWGGVKGGGGERGGWGVGVVFSWILCAIGLYVHQIRLRILPRRGLRTIFKPRLQLWGIEEGGVPKEGNLPFCRY